MSERSELLKKVLHTWDYSQEGRQYLEWLIKPEAANLDGGDVLREAVLDVFQEDDQLNKLRANKIASARNEALAGASEDDRKYFETGFDAIAENLSLMKRSVRDRAQAIRDIRRALGRDRLETLEFVGQMQREMQRELPPDDLLVFFKEHGIAEELAAKVTALSRTTTEPVDVAGDLRRHSLTEEPWRKIVHEQAENPGEDWFDYTSEKLDRYYARQLVARLEKIVKRASSLEPVRLKVTDRAVCGLFQEAHDAFVYGFHIASIALCRSLMEHALRDKVGERGKLRDLIATAKNKEFLDDDEHDRAKKVETAGNEVMHDMSSLRRKAKEILDCTRIVLNKLYGSGADGAAAS